RHKKKPPLGLSSGQHQRRAPRARGCCTAKGDPTMRRTFSLALTLTATAVALLTPRAHAHNSSELTDLGLLPGYAEAVPFGINNSNQVVGFGFNQGSSDRAFLWDPGSGMHDLGSLPGYGMSIARGINDHGEVAGDAWTFGQENYVGWVWSPNSGMARLDPIPGY